MDTYMGIILIVVILVAVLMIGKMKSQTEWLINFLLRCVFGMMSNYFFKFILSDAFPGLENR